MTKPSEALLAAERLLKEDPLPTNAEQQLEELERQVRPDEVVFFSDIWEAFIVKNSLNTDLNAG